MTMRLSPSAWARRSSRREQAFALFGAALAEREQLASAGPRRRGLGIGENVRRAVAEHEPRADREGAGPLPSPPDGRAPRRRPNCGRRRRCPARPSALACIDQLFAVGGPAQEREIGGDGELGIDHAPSRNVRTAITRTGRAGTSAAARFAAEQAFAVEPGPQAFAAFDAGNNRGSARCPVSSRHHSMAMRSGPSAMTTSCSTRRQRNRAGGPSGTSAIASTGSGRSNRRTGRVGARLSW